MFVSESPILMDKWHCEKNATIDPSSISCNSSKVVWWKCPVSGGEWKSPIYHVYKMRSESPFVSGRKIKVGFNDLASKMPHVAAMWHPTKNGELTPEMVTVQSKKRVWWLCPESGGEWENSVQSVCKSNGASPFVSGHRLKPGYNDFFTTHPHVAFMWDFKGNKGIDPHNLKSTSRDSVWWVCPHSGGRWKMKISTMCRVGGYNSPFVMGDKILPGYNDLATTHPEVAHMWHEDSFGSPRNYTPDSKCEKFWNIGGKRERMRICDVVDKMKMPCLTAYLEDKENAILNTLFVSDNPEVSHMWHPTKNGDVNASDTPCTSSKMVWWLCPESGGEWRASVQSVCNNKVKSPFVRGSKALEGYNDLSTTHPHLVDQWSKKNGELTPQMFTASSTIKVWWKCPVSGGEWRAPISSRVEGKGSPFTDGKKVLQGFNDLETKFPEVAAMWHPTKNGDVSPCDIVAQTNKKYWWKDGGRVWNSSPNTIISNSVVDNK